MAGILGLGLAACGGGEDDGAKEHPTSGPEYEQAMVRCALSRLQNGGVEEPSTQSGAYLDAYTACTYGRSFDDVSAPARG
ncbi:hypothetical protein ABZ467_35610 [Streptomyces sp. NPDC005727]|uniref:hypothetical protein n=1 Tax=Streptomyces sp. NPDC005727 TaxID=3157053 RepID=UPI0033D51F90